MSLKGNVKTMPIGDLLQFISMRQSTGTLELVKATIWKRLYFEKGRIISSGSSDPSEYLGHFLIAENKITEDQLTQAMEVQQKTKVMLGKILVMIGAVSEEEMLQLLELKCKETLFSMFFWEEADFEFFDNQLPAVRLIPVSLEVQSLIEEGGKRRERYTLLRRLYPKDAMLQRASPQKDVSAGDTFTQNVYNLIDGHKTVGDIAMHTHAGEFRILRALDDLKQKGAISIGGLLEHQENKTFPGIPVLQMLEMGKNKLAYGKWEDAINLFTYVLQHERSNSEAKTLLEQAEKQLIQAIYEDTIAPDSIPQLTKPIESFASEHLTSEEGFLVTRINGRWDLKSILTITPLREVDALRIIKRLIDRNLVCV